MKKSLNGYYLKNLALKSFSGHAKPAAKEENPKESMNERFHDIYTKELEKLKKHSYIQD